jgi:hypothetical protein
MHSLSELREHFARQNVSVQSYNGWQLVADGSTWSMALDVLYRDGAPVDLKSLKKSAKTSVKTPSGRKPTP